MPPSKVRGFSDLRELFDTKYDLDNDRYSKRTVCRVCRVTFYEELDFWKHLAKHNGLYSCNSCNKQFHNLSKIAMHLAKPHPDEDKTMTCKICDLNFGGKLILDEHINLHFNSRPFICKLCKKRFTKATNLKLHEKNFHKKGLKVNRSPLGSMSILVDRIETKEKEVCRLSGKTPLAIFKSRNENILVHIISAFPTKDLLVPVPAEDLPSYLIEQDTVKSEDTEETSLTNPHEKMVPIVAFVERNNDKEDRVTLDNSSPSEQPQNRFPVSMLSNLQVKSNNEATEQESNCEPRVKKIELFRAEVTEKFLKKKLKDSEKLECHFVDVVDFGEMKLEANF